MEDLKLQASRSRVKQKCTALIEFLGCKYIFVIKYTERLCTVKYWREKRVSDEHDEISEKRKKGSDKKIMIPDRLSSSKT